MYFKTDYLYNFKGRKLDVVLFKYRRWSKYYILRDGKEVSISRESLVDLLGYKDMSTFQFFYKKLGVKMLITKDIQQYYKHEHKKTPDKMKKNVFIVKILPSTNYFNHKII